MGSETVLSFKEWGVVFSLSVLKSLTLNGDTFGMMIELISVDLTLSKLDLRIIIICKTIGSSKTNSRGKNLSPRNNLNMLPRPTTKLATKEH